MATEILMPKWGLSMQEGLIGQWLKQEGDAVQQGEPLVEIETEKITNVVEAAAAGILRIVHPAGATIPVTQVIAWITAPGEAAPGVAAPAAPTSGAASAQTVATPAAMPSAAPVPAPTGGNIAAMPTARRVAKERGIDLATVQGSGPNGVITLADVERAAAAPPLPSAGGIIPATPVARKLAKEHGLDLATVSGSGPNGTITKDDIERVLAAKKATPSIPAGTPIASLQKVGFYSDSHRLDGLLYSPKGASAGDGRPGVVLCVGYTYLKTMVMPDIAKVLTAAGYVALVFDYRGFGDSEGTRGRLMPNEQVSDARAALTFLTDQPHVNPAKLAVIGISLGGSHAITVGALDKRVGAVVALEPMGDGKRWLRSLRRHWEWQAFLGKIAQDRSDRVRSGQSAAVDSQEIVLPDPESRAFLDQVANEFPQSKCSLSLASAEALIEYSPESVVSRLSPRPALIIHGDNDQLVPVDEARSLAQAAGAACRLAVLPDMGHFNWVMPNSPGFRRVADLTVQFLQEVLPTA